MITENDLQNICINVSQKLVLLPNEKQEINELPNLQSKLIFPQKERKTEIRISEQESRVLFCHSIENYYEQIHYSIETPTEEKYSFSDKLEEIKHHPSLGQLGQSALFDMSLFEFENKRFIQKVNIELKAHNVEISHIAKDILKLFVEKQSALFYHTVKAVDSGTLKNKGGTGILDKYIKSCKEFSDKWKPFENGNEKYILFALCILEHKVLLMKTFKESDLKNIDTFFNIEYTATRTKISFTNLNNWIKEDLT